MILLMVFFAGMPYNEGVRLHSPFQQETPVLADGGFSNPSKGRDPMHELYLSYDSTIQIANPIPLVLMNSGVICVKAVL
jgi:hypothetical protein